MAFVDVRTLSPDEQIDCAIRGIVALDTARNVAVFASEGRRRSGRPMWHTVRGAGPEPTHYGRIDARTMVELLAKAERAVERGGR